MLSQVRKVKMSVKDEGCLQNPISTLSQVSKIDMSIKKTAKAQSMFSLDHTHFESRYSQPLGHLASVCHQRACEIVNYSSSRHDHVTGKEP